MRFRMVHDLTFTEPDDIGRIFEIMEDRLLSEAVDHLETRAFMLERRYENTPTGRLAVAELVGIPVTRRRVEPIQETIQPVSQETTDTRGIILD
jgi:hypothetical protein